MFLKYPIICSHIYCYSNISLTVESQHSREEDEFTTFKRRRRHPTYMQQTRRIHEEEKRNAKEECR